MKIYTDNMEGTTVIQNSFIDRYMPCANGEYVKIYLYLLRCADTGRELTLTSIADVFDHTESDIRRALAYWEKQQLLCTRFAKDGTLETITFSGAPLSDADGLSSLHTADSGSSRVTGSVALPAAGASPAQTADSSPAKSETSLRSPSDMPSRSRVEAAREEHDMRQLFFIAEQYLQRPLTSSEQREFVYYYDSLQFSADLIEYLIEYCISKGCASCHYMRKVALSWAEAGISTVLQAKQEASLYNRNYFTIMNAFGIKGRNPAMSEQETMSRWLNDFAFTIDIILEACKRTIRQTHQPSFQYADRILEQWHNQGVLTMSDIEKLDAQRKQEQKKPSAKSQRSQGNRFNNFSQREYDYGQLEKQLLSQTAGQ